MKRNFNLPETLPYARERGHNAAAIDWRAVRRYRRIVLHLAKHVMNTGDLCDMLDTLNGGLRAYVDGEITLTDWEKIMDGLYDDALID